MNISWLAGATQTQGERLQAWQDLPTDPSHAACSGRARCEGD